MLKHEKILITGGARSGKSEYALKLVRKGKRRVFIATAEALDEHMKKRIEAHRRKRGKRFKTVEEPKKLAEALEAQIGQADVVIIDCLTIWLSNLILQGMSDRAILSNVKTLARTARDFPGRVIIVTNEVGAGIVPENELARRFRDLAGSANQVMAKASDTLIMMNCGIPLLLKGD
jgi:adenosyl cobinamide kinase/adenosyl cobinamide phosphate guanylyltransferase